MDNPCDEGEGDCDSNDECSGNLYCARGCSLEGGGSIASLGGDWDEGDDCCLDPSKYQADAAFSTVRFNTIQSLFLQTFDSSLTMT